MRDKQLDIYRSIVMMYIVTIIHTLYWLGIPTSHISRSWLLVEMPVIFFIAGASYKLSYKPNRQYKTYIWSRICRIVKPYIYWCIICVALFGSIAFVLQSLGIHFNRLEPFYRFENYIQLLKCESSKLVPLSYHIWFIPIYLYVCLLAPLLYRVYTKSKNRFTAYLILGGGIVLIINDIYEYESNALRNVIVYSIFFGMGFFYKELSKTILMATSFGAFITCLVLYVLGLYSCDMQVNKFPPNTMFLLYGIGVLCFLGSCFTNIKIRENTFVKYYNAHGYTIYLYQNIGFFIASITFSRMYASADNILYKGTIFIITLIFLLTFHAFIAGCIDKITKKLP